MLREYLEMLISEHFNDAEQNEEEESEKGNLEEKQ